MVVSGCAEKSETHKCIKGVLHQETIRDEEMEQHFEKFLRNTTAEKDSGVQCNMAQSAWVKEVIVSFTLREIVVCTKCRMT